VRSPKGAVGLMQVMPTTARAVARQAGLRWDGVWSLEHPAVNVRLGVRYLAHLESRYRSRHRALVAYAAGPLRAERLPARIGRSPYVRRVLARYERLLAEWGSRRAAVRY
jgi:soluble lytic murein transglycosylase-like protein